MNGVKYIVVEEGAKEPLISQHDSWFDAMDNVNFLLDECKVQAVLLVGLVDAKAVEAVRYTGQSRNAEVLI